MQEEKESFKDNLSLWNSFLSGDDAAYASIYKQHVQSLFLYGLVFTIDEDLVKDCIQDVFIRLYKNRSRLGKTDNIKLYLLTALKNELFNTFKKQNNYHRIIHSIELEETADTADENLLIREDEAQLQKQVASLKSLLTTRQQEVIHYRFVEDLSIEEIAGLLQLNYQSVANIIQRALKKMRSFYLISPSK